MIKPILKTDDEQFTLTAKTRNSSRDEVANVNFLRRHIQPLLRSAPKEATKFGEITQNKGHYGVQGHSR